MSLCTEENIQSDKNCDAVAPAISEQKLDDSNTKAARAGRRPAVAFVFVAVMLDMIALGITVPVLPSLITQMLHGDAARAASYVGGFAAIWALMQFFASPVIGSLSDRFGRRPVLLASMFGLAADYVVMALASFPVGINPAFEF